MNLERWKLCLEKDHCSVTHVPSEDAVGCNTLQDAGTLYKIMHFVGQHRLDSEPPAHEIVLALFPKTYRKTWEDFFLNIAANVLQGSAGPPPKVVPDSVWTYSSVTLRPRTIKVEELPDE